MSIKTLVINPGSTSTKVGVFEDEALLFEETLRHPTEEIAKYASVIDQKDFRKAIILDFLKEKNCAPESLNVIVGRGGLLKPIPGGTYPVSDALLADLKAGVQGQHASNLGGILAREIGDSLGIPSYIVDPVVVDELTDKARISGMPELPRRSIFHALNQKAVARRYAKENGKRYEDLNLIVIHMGGGVSVGAHNHGKVVDVNNILDGEGCFSPERSGTVPVGDLVKMCFSGKYTQQEVYKKICGNGGFNGYLHTNDARTVGERAANGDELAKQVWDAFFYQIAKDAGAMAAVLHGKVDQIILTGGIAYNPYTAEVLKDYLGWIAPITVYPGEDELLGRGVSYCATCDAHFYKGKAVAVLGYNAESCREADFLAETCARVLYFPVVPHEVNVGPNVTVVRERVLSIPGTMRAEGVQTDKALHPVDGVFVLRDAVAPDKLVPGLATDGPHVAVDAQMRTNLPGCFACGDLAGKPYQYIKAAGQGNIAALSAVEWLAEQK